MYTLTGKVAVVTGSTSGIGREVVLALHREGAKVIINSRHSTDAGLRLAEELAESAYVRADVTERVGAAALVATAVERWGRLDLVVNNVGATRRIPHHDLEAASDEVWQEMFAGNLLGAWHVIQEAVPAMRRSGGGRIVNVSSMAGIKVMGSSLPYAAMKAALNHSTALLANALAPDIIVNAVAPGLTATPWTADWSDDRQRVRENSPLRRIGQPSDVAHACLALLQLDHITGVVLPVDGGMHLR